MQVLQSQVTTTEIEPQDEAMDQFRRLFKLVAGCNVSNDGKLMVYQMQTLPGAARWLSDAQLIITANLLPLDASVKAYTKKGQQIPERVELRIVYTL
jgi:hypothetical protein